MINVGDRFFFAHWDKNESSEYYGSYWLIEKKSGSGSFARWIHPLNSIKSHRECTWFDDSSWSPLLKRNAINPDTDYDEGNYRESDV